MGTISRCHRNENWEFRWRVLKCRRFFLISDPIRSNRSAAERSPIHLPGWSPRFWTEGQPSCYPGPRVRIKPQWFSKTGTMTWKPPSNARSSSGDFRSLCTTKQFICNMSVDNFDKNHWIWSRLSWVVMAFKYNWKTIEHQDTVLQTPAKREIRFLWT